VIVVACLIDLCLENTSIGVLKHSLCYCHHLNPSSNKIPQHGTCVWCIIMQVLSADGEQGQLSHEFLILRIAVFSIYEVEFLMSGAY